MKELAEAEGRITKTDEKVAKKTMAEGGEGVVGGGGSIAVKTGEKKKRKNNLVGEQ